MSAVIDHMRKVPLFRGMSTSALETVADRATETTFADGETVTREGEPGNAFYIVTDGRLHVSKEGTMVRDLGPGDFLGEIALVDGGPRTATVTADGPVQALVIRRADFLEMIEWDSAVRLGILTALTERIRKIDGGLLYEYTVNDPKTWTRPWTAEVPMVRSDAPMFEYACHEGNYGMTGLLSGARAVEKKPSTK